MKTTSLIKIFISCPSDISSEIDSIKVIVEEINKTSGRQGNYVVHVINWKTDTYSAIGTDPQDAINHQIDDEYDILVSLIWQRLGTPTKRSESGTTEEINRAIDNNSKMFLIFFKTAVENLNEIDIGEIGKINKFKNELSEKGVIFKEFNSTTEFESMFRINLPSIISDFLNEEKKMSGPLPTESLQPSKYADLDEFLEQVENQDESELDIDIHELVEEGLTYLNNITMSMTTYTSIIEDFGNRLTSRTNELNKYKGIKDERLKASKSKTAINLLSGEMNDLTSRLITELPFFTENFTGITISYPKILHIADRFKTEETEELKSSVKEFRDSMSSMTKQMAEFTKEIMKWPPVDTGFNRSKRGVELALKDLVKELLTGLKIFDEIIE